jgi:hypothetical protein
MNLFAADEEAIIFNLATQVTSHKTPSASFQRPIGIHSSTWPSQVDMIRSTNDDGTKEHVKSLQDDLAQAKRSNAPRVDHLEPIAPSSTMAYMVGADSNLLARTLAPVACHGIMASLFNEDTSHTSGELIKSYLKPGIGLSSHPDDIIAPSSDQQCPWNMYLADPFKRVKFMRQHESLSPNPDPAVLSQPARCFLSHEHGDVSIESVCLLPASNLNASWDDVCRYTAKLHTTSAPFFGTRHGHAPTHVTTSADLNAFNASSNMVGIDSPIECPPGFLVCRYGHTVCSSCLLSHWMNFARQTSLTSLHAQSQQLMLKCPVPECPCHFSVEKVWPFLYNSVTFEHAQLAIRRSTPHHCRIHPPLHLIDLEWFFFVWFPIVYYTKHQWKRVCAQPDEVIWMPNASHPIRSVVPSDEPNVANGEFKRHVVTFQHFFFQWKRDDTCQDAHEQVVQPRLMSFGIACPLSDAIVQETSFNVMNDENTHPRGVDFTIAQMSQLLEWIRASLLVVCAGWCRELFGPIVDHQHAGGVINPMDMETIFNWSCDSNSFTIALEQDDKTYWDSIYPYFDVSSPWKQPLSEEELSDVLDRLWEGDSMDLSPQVDEAFLRKPYSFQLQHLPLHFKPSLQSADGAPLSSFKATFDYRKMHEAMQIARGIHRLYLWDLANPCPCCGNTVSSPVVTSESPRMDLSGTPYFKRTPFLRCGQCESVWCVQCRRLTLDGHHRFSQDAFEMNVNLGYWQSFMSSVLCNCHHHATHDEYHIPDVLPQTVAKLTLFMAKVKRILVPAVVTDANARRHNQWFWSLVIECLGQLLPPTVLHSIC